MSVLGWVAAAAGVVALAVVVSLAVVGVVLGTSLSNFLREFFESFGGRRR